MSTPAEELPDKDAPETQPETATPAPTPDPARPKQQLAFRRFQQAEYTRDLWMADVPRGTTIDDLLDESYWAHVAQFLRPRARIEVMCEDNSYFVELLVLGVGKLYAQVVLLRAHELTQPIKRKVISPYNVEWSAGKFRVLRGFDIIKEGFDTEKDAQRWIDNHEVALER